MQEILAEDDFKDEFAELLVDESFSSKYMHQSTADMSKNRAAKLQ